MAEHNEFAIEINNLSKKVRKKQLLSPLNHQLTCGKILALCGGNGAGKSTLIRLMTGLIKPTTGQVTINSFTKKHHTLRFQHEFGYMPDDFQFQKSITAKETIRFYAKLKKISNARMNETLEEVGLLDKVNEKVGTFSKGMNQRLLLAQALLAKPNILILDEPTNGLDPYWVKQFSDMMLRAKKNGQTIVFSTHDLHVAEQIADEVMFLSNGEVISKGPINEYSGIGLYETFQQLYFNSIEAELRVL
ncbi:ABC transporter ATP-binding protein [Pseudogracilibacillus auburnensis]|uniref:ABC transporter ATP-binding protein n=1 Tax=Pseudogracilibacillus auburnensis TaxID=1494959 RepID=UPI001A966BD9|nr:ABC transporter ATP-binding protein [Pseudogracilibacillus auburnensis]MBO1002249.1 ABC transporter ATP-binding protein [Pseudogracilibacillus auburnensis]